MVYINAEICSFIHAYICKKESNSESPDLAKLGNLYQLSTTTTLTHL